MNLILKTLLPSLVYSFLLLTAPAKAQVTPDTTLGNEASRLTPNQIMGGASADRIDGGAQRGINLFHSFSQFNIGDGQRVYFGNPVGVENILTRVTGASASNILGTLGVDGAANLFLINPNGILFGQNARLDVRGSFVGTTANGVKFGDLGVFDVADKQAPALLTINPSALLFNQINPNAAIQNNSVAPIGKDPTNLFDIFGLRVPDGKSLVLVGGNVNMDGGHLNAYGGRVELGGLMSDGSVNLFFDTNNLRLGFPENATRATVTLTNKAFVYVEGAGGGDIALNARNIKMEGGSGLFSGIGLGLGTPETVAGDITLTATGEIVIDSGSTIGNFVRSLSQGNGGNIAINAGSFSLTDGARFNASTNGQGNAGNVTVNAKDSVFLTGNSYILSTVEPGGIGKGGNININANSLSLTNGAQLLTITRGASTTKPAGKGNAGNVNVKVTDVVDIAGVNNQFASGIRSLVDIGTEGQAGNITIDSGTFKLRSGALLSAATFGKGNAGNVTVNAKDSIFLTGNSYIFSTVEAGGIGKGGNIDIIANSLSLTDGASLLTATRQASESQPAGQGSAGNVNINVTGKVDIAGQKNGFPSAIFSRVSTGTVGNGGDISIDAGSFSLRSGAELTASNYGKGDAGNVILRAKDTISLDNNAYILSILGIGSVGKSGNIDINANSLSLVDGAQLITSTYGIGSAGNVTVRAKDAVSLEGNAYILSTVEAGGVGKGGNIDINANLLSLTDGAQLATITRSASKVQPAGQGNAGGVNINITGEVNIVGQKNGFSSGIRSLVDTGTVGNGGSITINSGSFSLSSGAELTTSTYGKGNAGNVILGVKDAVQVAGNTYILSTVEAGGIGKGGNIDIITNSLSLTDGAQLLAATREASNGQPAGQGDAGNVNINATGLVDIAGQKNGLSSAIFSRVSTGTIGNGGNITIDAGSFKLRSGAGLVTSTLGQGNAGNVTVRAKDTVFLAGQSTAIFSTVEAGGVGKGGNIDIITNSLSLTDGAQLLTATREASNGQPAGQGDAGNVNINATGLVDIAGQKNGLSSAIFSRVSTGTIGNGGNITIDAGSFKLRSGAGLVTSTLGQGNAGNVTVRAKDAVQVASNAYILSTVGVGSIGKGGDIDIYANSLSLTDGVQLLTSTYGIGNGGNVTVRAKDTVFLAGQPTAIFSTVEAGGIGKGGNINIIANSLSLTDGAQLSTATREASDGQPAGQGDAGNVNINVTGVANIAGQKNGLPSAIFSRVSTGTIGNGGNITIDAGSLNLIDGARLNTSTFGIGNAGNVTVRTADTVQVAGITNIFSTVEAGGIGRGGNININAATLSLIDGGQLATITRRASNTQPAGKGSAGDVNVKVTGVVDITGVREGYSSAIFSGVETGTEGSGGDITIDAGSFKLRDGAILDARIEKNDNNNKGGDITINTNVFEALIGGQLTTTTESFGSAGKITVNATNKVTINGSDPNYNNRIANFLPERISNIGANAGFFVNSTGAGTTGDIEINSPNITLDNQGKLEANSTSGNGGNIKLNSDLLLLRRGAQISTNAGTQQQGGDGGNIDIDSRFIVAVPTENSNITANAFTGIGGNVNIRTQGILGIQPRLRESPQTSDITASSDRGVQGQISIAEPDVEPAQGLIELPEEVVDATRRVAQICPREPLAKPLGEFIITGRGSLPPSPLEPLTGATNQQALATLEQENSNNKVPVSLINNSPTPQIAEAQGWVKTSDGGVELVATAPVVTEKSTTTTTNCPVVQ